MSRHSNPTDRDRPTSRRRIRADLRVENLEGRALLSTLGGGQAGRPVAAAVEQAHHPTLIQGPIRNLVGPGYAVKSPRFYERFAGPPLSELSVAGAKARVDNVGNLVLTGIVAAAEIPAAIEPGGTPLYYLWGIDRGGSPVPGPIPGRPHITYDTLVVVGVTEQGVNASLIDVASGETTALPTSSVLFKRNAVEVSVPPVLGGPIRAAGVRRGPIGPTVNFFTSTAAPETAGIGSLAAFAPEFRNFPVKIAPVVGIPVATRFRR